MLIPEILRLKILALLATTDYFFFPTQSSLIGEATEDFLYWIFKGDLISDAILVKLKLLYLPSYYY